MTLTRRSVLVSACSAALIPAIAKAAKLVINAASKTQDGVTVNIRDLSPRFLDFYASAQGSSADERFRLWKDKYDFAAVPPTPEGDAVARKLLDAAWPRYPLALAKIKAGATGMRPEPLQVAREVAELLAAEIPISIGVTTYVGCFETNAFTTGTPTGPVVAVPLEIDDGVRGLLFPHEMTHAVHMLTAHLSPGYERTLGRVVFEEGLAMHAAKRLRPGLPDFRYVGEAAWFDAAMKDQRAIFTGLRTQLERTDGPTLFKFTMGSGGTGREREAYVVGWLVVARLLAEGRSFPALARIAEAEMPALVGRTMDSLSEL